MMFSLIAIVITSPWLPLSSGIRAMPWRMLPRGFPMTPSSR